LAKPEDIVGEIIDGRYVALNVYDDQEQASQVFKMNNRTAIPVVDDNDILLGIVTIDDILWVTNEEFSEDMQKMGGTEALNEPYLDISIFNLARMIKQIVGFEGDILTDTNKPNGTPRKLMDVSRLNNLGF
jgi:magnesium transporter